MKRANWDWQSFFFPGKRPSKVAQKRKERRQRQAQRKKKARARAEEEDLEREMRRLRKSARSGRTGSTRKLEQLFHEVYGPQENPAQLQAIKNALRDEATMAKKAKSKKKKRTRKGKMPAGLRKYWAAQRRKKAKRKNPAHKPRRRRRARTRTITRTVIRYRTRVKKVYPKRRRAKRNPSKRSGTIRIKAPYGLTGKGLRKFRAMAAKAYGAPARIVSR